jgi:ribosomal protein L32E
LCNQKSACIFVAYKRDKDMTTTQIKYNKVLNVIQDNNGLITVSVKKVSELETIISNLECFSIALDNSKIKKTVKIIESLGFSVDVDETYGFEWESKIYCNVKV